MTTGPLLCPWQDIALRGGYGYGMGMNRVLPVAVWLCLAGRLFRLVRHLGAAVAEARVKRLLLLGVGLQV